MKIQAMIIDDEIQSVKVLAEKVNWKLLGIERVFEALSPFEARRILENNRVQLILCDIEMPGESGLEFIQWLREESDLNGKLMECIILTCYPEYEYMRKAMQLGCSDYLIKPVNMDEVENVIRKAVLKLQKIGNEQLELDAAEPDNGYSLIDNSVIPYIKEHFTQMLTLSDIADNAALNPQYMMRIFKKKTGDSVLEYVTRLRLELSKEMLAKTQWSNEIISEKVGYASPNYFIKLFKRQYGITPREFRKNNRKE